MISTAARAAVGGNAVWGEYFGRRIDQIRVYDRALSPAELQMDVSMPVGSGGTSPPRPPSALRILQ
jgi:hypothetical protein